MSTTTFPTIGQFARVTRGQNEGFEGQVVEIWDDYGKVEIRADDGVGAIVNRSQLAPLSRSEPEEHDDDEGRPGSQCSEASCGFCGMCS